MANSKRASRTKPRDRGPEPKTRRLGRVLEGFALAATEWAGGNWAFAVAVGAILLWAVTGPLFGFSDTWQLVINTGTTVITFLMVFLIQRAQNKESKVVQLKLNEIVAALHGASNRLIDVESLSEEEINILKRHYAEIAALAARRGHVLESHSIEEARARDKQKERASAAR